MKRTVFVAGLLAIGVTAAIAQSNVVEQRQSLMKEMGAQVRTLSGMMREQAPFNLAQVQSGLKVIADNTQKALHLFPENSKDAEKTAVLPVIWQDKAGFEAIFAKINQDAQNAAANIKDEATLKSELPKVLQSCGTCHNKFRKST